MWDEEEIETLKRLWAAGLTATEIAAAMVWPTRNAIIGKVHRLKLPMRKLVPPPMRRGSWTDAQVAELRAAIRDGCSLRQVEARVGRAKETCKRKAAELGIPWLAAHVQRRPPAPRRPRCRPAPLPEVKTMFVVPTPEPPQPTTGGITIMDLRSYSCRYIIRHGRSMAPGTTFYCGEPRDAGLAWCAHHRKVVSGDGTLAERQAHKEAA